MVLPPEHGAFYLNRSFMNFKQLSRSPKPLHDPQNKIPQNLFSTIAGHQTRCRPQIPTIAVHQSRCRPQIPTITAHQSRRKKIPQSQADHMWRQQISSIAAQGRKRERQRRRQRDGVHNLKLKFVGVFFSNMSFAAAK